MTQMRQSRNTFLPSKKRMVFPVKGKNENKSSPNMSLWHIDYFKFKAFKILQSQEGHGLPFPTENRR